MEEITRKEGRIYYGAVLCGNANEAYCRFREDYHKSLGKAYYRRLNRPPRKERIHDSGMYLTEEYHAELERRFKDKERVPCRIMGIVDICYVRMVGIWDCSDIAEQDFDDYMEWLFSRGSNALRLVGRGDMAGRTSKRLKTRYR